MKRVLLSIIILCMCMLNAFCQNQKAPDFEYMTLDLKEHSLYKTKSHLTLVYLYNPQCYECIATIDILRKDEAFSEAVKSKKLTVLAVDLSEDMESIIYKMYPPQGWTLCFDIYGKILSENLFGQDHIPSMYLLDKRKNFILKSPSHNDLLDKIKDLIKK
ncbi:MAG: thioredoxin family protein [Bacteroidales bacterium]|nr:thioredoxin family protein [Bacteroidales bacterium]